MKRCIFGLGGLYEEGSDYIKFGDNSNNYTNMRVSTNNKIDVTSYSTLCFEG